MRIYAEGGGEGQLLDTLFRQGWSDFFRSAGLERMPKVIRGKGRTRTFDLFKKAVQNPTAGTIPLLLVDSEGPVQPEHTAWQHLKARDNWDQPIGATDDDAFLMVQVMETWFVADRVTLRAYFGPRFNDNALREWPDVEAVPKETILRSLESATATCSTGYAKGRVSFELLSRVNPDAVEQKCRHARQLLWRLRSR